MATKVARLNGPHSAGIFADMTIDGPEIGTLVLIVDRAKNLPNKKTMGKQNPYCAARLGKEAQKTETDKRGGQTPRWDQELRFTVHDSPDYYNLKISVFSEDKRTDLVGEAWVTLNDVIVPGGGKSDLWQALNCKGRYAGDLRIELTYYDSRQKPDKAADTNVGDESVRSDVAFSRVKRRPLPTNPNVPSTTPVVIPERPHPGRARHGPRNLQMPARPSSMPQQELSYPYSQATLMVQKPVQEMHASSPLTQHEYPPSGHFHHEEPAHTNYGFDEPAPMNPTSQPGFSSQHQYPMPIQQSFEPAQALPRHNHPYQGHNTVMPHSHSAPSIPMAHPDHRGYSDSHQPPMQFHSPEPSMDPHNNSQDYHQRVELPTSDHQQREYTDPYSDKQVFEEGDEEMAPPPPPVHSKSAPVIPHYSSPHGQPVRQAPSRYEVTPPRPSQQYVSNSSPLQSIERSYVLPDQAHYHSHRYSTDEYGSSPLQQAYHSTPPNSSPAQAPSPYGRTPPSQEKHSRHSVAEPYYTPPRHHPLSQEVSQDQMPDHYREEELVHPIPQQPGRDLRERRSWAPDIAPIIKPRAISPSPGAVQYHRPSAQPPPPQAQQQYQTPYQHQHQLHQTPPEQQPQPATKTFKPRNSYNIQFPVRAFESSDESPLSTSQPTPPRTAPIRKSVSPRPSTIGSSPSAVPFSPDSFDVHNPNYQSQAHTEVGPIVDWDGSEVHPSDHLPVDSWAPEPEPKVPNKTYGLGRDRDFGPRAPQGVPTSSGRISKDTLFNIRRKAEPVAGPPAPASAPPRTGRLQKPRSDKENVRDSRSYNQPARTSYAHQEHRHSFSEGLSGPVGGYDDAYDTHGAPSIPPKVPMQHMPDYDQSALLREISNIDIGASRSRPPPAATAYVPVRSHRDRNSFY